MKAFTNSTTLRNLPTIHSSVIGFFHYHVCMLIGIFASFFMFVSCNKEEIPNTEEKIHSDISYTLLIPDDVVTPYTPISMAETSDAYFMELAMSDSKHLNWLYVSKTEKGVCYLLSVCDQSITFAPYNLLNGKIGGEFMTFCVKNDNWYMNICSYNQQTGTVIVDSVENIIHEDALQSRVVRRASSNDDMDGARKVLTNFLSDFAGKLSKVKDVLEVAPVTKPAAFPLKVITSCIIPIAKLELYDYSDKAAAEGLYDYTTDLISSKIKKVLSHDDEYMEHYWTLVAYAFAYGFDENVSYESMKQTLNKSDNDYVFAFSRNVPSFMQNGEEPTTKVINGMTDVTVSVSGIDYNKVTLSAKVSNYDTNSFATIMEAGYVISGNGKSGTYTVSFTRTDTNLSSVTVKNLKPSTQYQAYAYIRTSFTKFKSSVITFTTSEDENPEVQPTGGKAIDMGLSVKWASYNVGASSPEEYGNFYAWGSTEPQEYYNWLGYEHRDRESFSNSEHYYLLIGENIAGTKYDVAHVKWGGTWVMPTQEQIKELRDNTTEKEMSYNGVDGVLLISNKNGNCIFFPYAGYIETQTIWQRGKRSEIWSSECIMPEYNLAYTDVAPGRWSSSKYRCYGCSVRPVCNY